MTYARSRLWLGISGVGLQVVVAVVSLSFGLPHRLLSGLSNFAAILMTLFAYVLISLPSDLLGGYLLPRRHGRSAITPVQFAAGWARGVLVQTAVVCVCALALITAGRVGGGWAAAGCFALLMVAMLEGQAFLARAAGGFRPGAGQAEPMREMPAVWVEARDPGFVGGIVGLPGREMLIVPAAWSRELPAEVLRAELLRRRGVVTGSGRTRGLAVAALFNLAGFALACHLPGASVSDAPGLIQTAQYFALWSFLGLLTLPTLNRPGVFAADHYAQTQGTPRDVLAEAIRTLDRRQDDEPARGRWVERIFHPIPSVESRLEMLAGTTRPKGAWQCARMSLYLSWACFGFLSRAVHCNAGRPELWVLFPGD